MTELNLDELFEGDYFQDPENIMDLKTSVTMGTMWLDIADHALRQACSALNWKGFGDVLRRINEAKTEVEKLKETTIDGQSMIRQRMKDVLGKNRDRDEGDDWDQYY